MVSRGKAVCNDTPVESIPEEGRRESWARHQAEEKRNVFRFTG
ncbi:hypothetical protein T06_56 [Trichinella sp. T6]|nr:hypothetical protein T06_56 [Trichinella sp. T6]